MDAELELLDLLRSHAVRREGCEGRRLGGMFEAPWLWKRQRRKGSP
jgi:hypothetical protein